MARDYDFSGWATKANLKCSDGRVIMKDAFKDNDGARVPLCWGHSHNDPSRVLGHADLENRDEGVYAYCKFNDTESGRTAKLLVQHGDVNALSIYANQLKQNLSNVIHGNIREVSLVLAGANPGAYIDSVMVHGEESDGEAYIYTGETLSLAHMEDDEEMTLEHEEKEDPNGGGTIGDVYETLNEEQKTAVHALIGQAIEDTKAGLLKDDEEDEEDMKHNVFDTDERQQANFITHSEQGSILEMAKKPGMTFQSALQAYAEENQLAHDAASSGFMQDTADGNVSWLFPEYKEVRPGAPELITNDQGWVTTVLSKVHKSPISRIRTSQVDIRNIDGAMDSLRAKGYIKGKQKGITGNFKLARRTTDPQTVYVKSALHRDDIIDITDFNYVEYLYNIDRMQLNEELATAIMLGDGRDDAAEGKIDPNHIRPIWLDDDLYTLHVDLDVAKARQELQGTNTAASFGENYVIAEAMVNTVLYAREKYKGTGTPDLFITPHMVNVMLLARDMNGRRIYSSVSELASALNVGAIYTAEQFEGKSRTTSDGKIKKLLCILTNLADYSLGATKGGEITHFTQFDLNFNQQISLLETRCSGALTRLWSAIAIEEDITDKG